MKLNLNFLGGGGGGAKQNGYFIFMDIFRICIIVDSNDDDKMINFIITGIQGYKIHLDSNGDAEFNLTLLDIRDHSKFINILETTKWNYKRTTLCHRLALCPLFLHVSVGQIGIWKCWFLWNDRGKLEAN